MLDYIVIGLGVAGFSFVQQLEENGKSFVVLTIPNDKVKDVLTTLQ